LKKRAFSRAVLSDHAEGLSASHLERDFPESPEIAMESPSVQRQQFLETVSRSVVDRIALGDALKLDGIHEVISSLGRWGNYESTGGWRGVSTRGAMFGHTKRAAADTLLQR
jgi:hypothetical protein